MIRFDFTLEDVVAEDFIDIINLAILEQSEICLQYKVDHITNPQYKWHKARKDYLIKLKETILNGQERLQQKE
jgi:hypothetical protein